MSEHKALYPYSYNEAVRNGEKDVELYRESHNENIACANDIKKALAENFDGYKLNAGIELPVIKKYGFDRVNYVLANTIQHFDYDGRISRENKEWAKAFFIPENKINGFNKNVDFIIDSAGLGNIFFDGVRKQFKELNLWDTSHCILTTGLDFKNKVMVLKPSVLKDEYKTPDYQLFYADNGFGCSPTARGQKVFGQFLFDGERTNYDRSNFIGQLKPELMPDWTKEKVNEIQKSSIRKQLAENKTKAADVPKQKQKNKDLEV